MTAKYDTPSPYISTPIVNKFLGFYVNRTIPKSNLEYKTIVLEQRFENAPDLLAKSIYGSGYEALWWVIPRYNSLEDLVFDLKTGITLRIPPKEVLDKLR